MIALRGVFLWTLLATAVSSTTSAQNPASRCQSIVMEHSERVTGVQQPDRSLVSYLGGDVVFVCPTEGIRLAADSAEYHEAAQIVYLFGRVRYTEGGTSVNARRITYWQRDERILAEGNVVATLENGTRMTGPRADYYRAIPGLRPRAQLRATDRPRILLVQQDTTRGRDTARVTAPRPPAVRGQAPAASDTARPAADTTVVDANTVYMDGDSLVYASGKVIVTRPDIVATSDSLALDRATERARFVGNPQIKGSAERSFTLTGAVIDLYSRERKLERVLSRVKAVVVSEDLRLTADTLDLRITADKLHRAYAWGTSRARAVSTAQDMTADSIEIIMPDQRLREVRALGKALAESEPDSTKITSDERDWLRGDTIVAFFDSIPLADTTSKPRIRELFARVRASSFYQIPPDDTTSRCPKINYARGHEIRVAFDTQTVRRVMVADSVAADGLYLECVPPAAAPRTPAPQPPPPRTRAVAVLVPPAATTVRTR
jgi:lipopolysaccharide export system protein LptA